MSDRYATTRPASRSRGGFTLTELLVVIVIIVILVGLLSSAAMYAWRSSAHAAAQMDLQAIASALDVYHSDHGMYPSVPEDAAVNGAIGARVLCRALIAPADEAFDGFSGPGFRGTLVMGPGSDGILGNSDDEQQGRVYQSYLRPEAFMLVDPEEQSENLQAHDRTRLAIAHAGSRSAISGPPYWPVILYYPANTAVRNLSSPSAWFVADEHRDPEALRVPMFDYGDHPSGGTWPTLVGMRLILGDFSRDEFSGTGSTTPTKTANGRIDGGESANHAGPYVLWSPGADGFYGPSSTSPAAEAFLAADPDSMPSLDEAAKNEVLDALRNCDDVTNFEFQEKFQ